MVITHNHNNVYQSPPSNTDNVLRLEVQVDDTKGVEVGDTLTNLKIGTQGFLVEIGTLVFLAVNVVDDTTLMTLKVFGLIRKELKELKPDA